VQIAPNRPTSRDKDVCKLPPIGLLLETLLSVLALLF